MRQMYDHADHHVYGGQFFIMAMIFLQPAQAVALAVKLPSPAVIGGGIVVLAMLEFLRRLWVHSKRVS